MSAPVNICAAPPMDEASPAISGCGSSDGTMAVGITRPRQANGSNNPATTTSTASTPTQTPVRHTALAANPVGGATGRALNDPSIRTTCLVSRVPARPGHAFAPPSTVRVLPVTMLAAGPARNTTASAISRGSA